MKNVAFLWHFHQPPYWLDGELSLLPWARLHALRDYLDMAPLLGEFPDVHMTFNFTPSLLEQLTHPRTDPFASAARKEPADLGLEEKVFLLRHFFSASPNNQIRPLPRYFELLLHRGPEAGPENLRARAAEWPDNRFLDLQVLFHLAWCGESLRRRPLIADLIRKGRRFTSGEKRDLLDALDAAPSEIIPLYKTGIGTGQISLTTTPANHPILPILVNAQEIREAHPELNAYPFPPALPDARWHVEEALRMHAALFGAPPRGIWPAEGGVSEGILPLLPVEAVFSDDLVLYRSVAAEKNILFPFRHPAHPALKLFFRNSELSNKFGFVYGGMPPEQAAEDFVRFVDGIVSDGVLWVILDGENPWGGYADLGRPFLRRLFERSTARGIRFLNLDDVLALDLPVQTIEHLHPGSWIDASFYIWTGDPVKNRAWDLLASARQSLRAAEAPEGAWTALRAAEASDWFWWYGKGNESPYKPDFDTLFRHYLKLALFRAGCAASPSLESPLESGGDGSAIEQPHEFIHPALDGRITSFYEWSGAVRVPVSAGESMRASERLVESLFLGLDAEHLYLRLDPAGELTTGGWEGLEVALHLVAPREDSLALLPAAAPVEEAHDRILEVAVPFSALHLEPGMPAAFYLELRGRTASRCPWTGVVKFTVPHPDYEEEMWRV